MALIRWTHYRQAEIGLLRALVRELRDDSLDQRYLRLFKQWQALEAEQENARKIASWFDR